MNAAITRLNAAPPLLIGASLLVWGWQCNFLPYALLMAILLETSGLLSWRWSITDKEFNTLSDFSGLMFFIAVVYIFTNDGARGIFVILTCLPFILFPLLITQKYSARGTMKSSALFVSLRKLDPTLSPEADREIDVSLPYFIICLISASAGNQRTILFFISVIILIAVVLWSVRPRRYSLYKWIITLSLALILAYFSQLGLRQLQASIEASFLGVFDQFMWRYRDPNRSTTAIGSLGRLKLSDRIVLRVKSNGKIQTPFLLREASYNTFAHGIWNNKDSEFLVIDQNLDETWSLSNNVSSQKHLTLSTYMVRDKGVIPLPHGTSKISNIAAIQIEKNAQGTVIMDMREGWIQYDAEYENKILDDAPPDKNDLYILDYYRDDFDKLADQLGLSSMSEKQAVIEVSRFFKENFSYSLNRQQRYPKGKYLANFLFKNRQGHCEYFATATALLLRSVNIPTRYVVGYSIDEYSSLERQYIARARHAHSWTQVYVNNQWQILDTTPAVWAPFEEENASAIEPLMDLWAWVSYTWALWQSEDVVDEEDKSVYLLWLLIPLIAVLAWRMYFKERVKHRASSSTNEPELVFADVESSFYQLINHIQDDGLTRHPGETLYAWFDRILSSGKNQQLQTALKLHYQYRFDPRGLSVADTTELKRLVAHLISSKPEWLHGQRQS